jgi:hypothetical protein
LPDLILANELAAYFAKLGAQKRLAAGQVQVFNPAERTGEVKKLFLRQIVAAVQVFSSKSSARISDCRSS